jgi:hypothetical protein
MTPLDLSVVLPVYNVAPYLRQCLDSLANQERPAKEIIAVDDGSTDESPAILAEYAAGRLPSLNIIRQENGGLSAARNTGLRYATGKWLAFVDSDDFVAPSMFQTLVEAAERDDLDIALCNGIYHFDDKQPERPIYTAALEGKHYPDSPLRRLIRAGVRRGWLPGALTRRGLAGADMLLYRHVELGDYPRSRKDMGAYLRPEVLAAARPEATLELWRGLAQSYGRGMDTASLMRADLWTYLSEDCLVKTDRASMDQSLEVRVPLLGNPVLDRVLEWPAAIHYDAGAARRCCGRWPAGIFPKQCGTGPSMVSRCPCSTISTASGTPPASITSPAAENWPLSSMPPPCNNRGGKPRPTRPRGAWPTPSWCC